MMTIKVSDTPPFDEKFSRYDEANAAGLAVMVIQDGETVFQKGYGLRNIERQEQVDCHTNFRMGSITKHFTAMCIAILEERGEISDDDAIKMYFTDLPDYTHDIKVRHLVHHLSGLPNYEGEINSTDTSKPYRSNEDVYNFYKTQNKLKFQPGDEHNYSNGGYNLLASLVEKATHQSFPDFVKENIFKPANMQNSAVVQFPLNIKNRATSYSAWPFFEDIDFNTGNFIYGAGGVYSSLTDMAAWVHALDNNMIISPSMTQKIFSPTKDNHGKEVRYGYGWVLLDWHSHKMVMHNGAWLGFNTILANFPDKNIWIAAFSNSKAISSESAFIDMAKYYLDIDV